MYENEKKRLADIREKRHWTTDDKLWALGMISSGIIAAEEVAEYQRRESTDFHITLERLEKDIHDLDAQYQVALEEARSLNETLDRR
jgi:hypothetical protein